MAVQEQETERGQAKLSVFISYNGMNESFRYTAPEAEHALGPRR